MENFREKNVSLVQVNMKDIEALKALYISNQEILEEHKEIFDTQEKLEKMRILFAKENMLGTTGANIVLREIVHKTLEGNVILDQQNILPRRTILAQQKNIEETLILEILDSSRSDRLSILRFLRGRKKLYAHYPVNMLRGIYDQPDTTSYGASALAAAFSNGHTRVMEFFLKNKANPNHTLQLEDNTHQIPWFMWCFQSINEGGLEACKLAHQYGANMINAKNNDGETFLMVLLENKWNETEELIAWLLQNGADPNCVDLNGFSVLDRRFFSFESLDFLKNDLLKQQAHITGDFTVDKLLDKFMSQSDDPFSNEFLCGTWKVCIDMGRGIGSCLSDKHCSLLKASQRIEGKLFIGATIYDRGTSGVKKITRFTPGFDKAITYLGELKEVFSAPEENQATLACLQKNFPSIKTSLENCMQKKESQLIKITESSSKEEVEQLNADLAMLNDTLHFLAVEVGHSPNGISISAMACDPLISQVVGGQRAHSQSSYYKLALAMNQERAKNMMLSAISADTQSTNEQENSFQNNNTTVDHLGEDEPSDSQDFQDFSVF